MCMGHIEVPRELQRIQRTIAIARDFKRENRGAIIISRTKTPGTEKGIWVIARPLLVGARFASIVDRRFDCLPTWPSGNLRCVLHGTSWWWWWVGGSEGKGYRETVGRDLCNLRR